MTDRLADCGQTAKYTGREPPTCQDGRGCSACWAKYRQTQQTLKKGIPSLPAAPKLVIRLDHVSVPRG